MGKFAHIQKRIRNLGEDNYCISSMWHETGTRKDGTIAEFPNLQTKNPKSFNKLILNGPHLYVGNPLFKTPNNPCKSHKSWVPIDLELIPDDFIPRCKYEQKCDDTTYNARQVSCKWDRKVFDEHWRVAYRSFIGIDNERSLTSGIYPPKVAHIHKIESIALKHPKDLISIAASFASLPLDFYVRTIGKQDLLANLIGNLPFVNYATRLTAASVRLLGLECLTRHYGDFWKELFKSDFRAETWTQTKASIDDSWFKNLTAEWKRSNALRSDLTRRQALLELDVLTAQALGLNFTDLLTLYRLRFRVLRDYEANTWYDQKGRIVFTTNGTLTSVGLSRKKRVKDAAEGISYCVNGYAVDAKGLGFEDVKDMKEGYVEKIFPDVSMTDAPVMTTVRYEAPFFQMDREADYRRAWEVFEQRFGKNGIDNK